MRIAATCFYVLMLAASIRFFSGWIEANAHLGWSWSLGDMSQCLLGMMVFSAFAAYMQIKSVDFNEVIALQYLAVGMLFVASWLSHAYPEHSSPIGFAHFLLIAGFVGWDLRALRAFRKKDQL